MITFCRPNAASFTHRTLRLSGDLVSIACVQARVGIAPSVRAESVVLEWISINTRACAVRLWDSVHVNTSRLERSCLFLVYVYTPTDFR